MGRPSKFKDEYIDQARKLTRLGAVDREVADFFEISEATLTIWKKRYPDFLASLKEGKIDADANVANSLYRRATGYSHKDTKFATFEGQITDSKEYTKHHAPDTTACIFWLKNRRPDLWRDKTEVDSKVSGKVENEFVVTPEIEEKIKKIRKVSKDMEKPDGLK